MFKASLIEDEGYYYLRRRILLIGIPSTILFTLATNFDFMKFKWIYGVVAIAAILLFIFQNKLQKILQSMVRNRKIEIDSDTIVIKFRDGKIVERLDMSMVKRIIVEEAYTMPDESIKDIFKQMNGKIIDSYLIIDIENDSRRFDFTIDSYHMIEQIKKVIAAWKIRGLQIEVVDQ